MIELFNINSFIKLDEIIDGSLIKKDDIIINLEANGLHTNGYSLIINLIKNNPEMVNDIVVKNEKFIDLALIPHRCYYQAIKDLFKRKIISGLAHITGGGIKENLNRILPEKYNSEII